MTDLDQKTTEFHPKVPLIQVMCDDCSLPVDPDLPDGEQFFPHTGEWVSLVPYVTTGEIQDSFSDARLQVRLDAIKGEDDEGTQLGNILGAHYEGIYQRLARRILEWSWTDAMGRPYPQPHGNASVFRDLSPQELGYLLSVIAQRNPSNRKNGLSPSPTGSSDTRRRRTRKPASKARPRGKTK